MKRTEYNLIELTINGFLFGIYKEKANIEDYKKIRQIYGSEELKNLLKLMEEVLI